MGVVNVTPDSFSDGGRFLDPERAVSAGATMAAEGADLLDVGGESTRPGAAPVSVEEELDRVLPVVKRLAVEVSVPISVDTRHAEVARHVLASGASVINDVSAGSDPAMFDVVRGAGAGMVLMHMRGDPTNIQGLTEYTNVVEVVRDYLALRVRAAMDAGIPWECLAVDPGLGFAKTADQSLLLMREIDALAKLDRPVMAGPSRKSFVGLVVGTEVHDRLEGTAAAVAWMAARGAHVVRVHDVKEMVRVVRVIDAIRRGSVEP